MNRVLVLFVLVGSLFAQGNRGELHLKVTDPAGFAAKSSVEVVSGANHYQQFFLTDDGGNLAIKRLPFGVYLLRIRHDGFAFFSGSVEIRSAAPTNKLVTLGLAPLQTTVEVKGSDTLIDPQRVGSVNQIGSQMITDRVTSLPGRSASGW